MRRLVLGAVGVIAVMLMTGCAHTTIQAFSDTDPNFAALQWRLFFAPLLLIAFAIVSGVFSLAAVIVTLRSAAKATRVRRWPLIASAVLLALMSVGGVVLLVLRLVSPETVTIAVASFGG